VIGVLTFENGRLTAVRLHPIDLGDGRRIPRLAGPEKGHAILKELRDLSRPYETIIRLDENVGTVEVRRPS
jgi:poly-gamma-glutamate synthesis protein (capsule biosynthesis protein)